MRAPHLNVSEVFGPTIQGEGRHAGQLASFLRLSGCNLSCSWCDSPYTWDWTRFNRADEVHRWDVTELAASLFELPGRLVVTGGEPLMQAPGLAALLAELLEASSTSAPAPAFDLETNGTRRLGSTASYWSTITCSPKVIPSSDQPTSAPLRRISLDPHPSVLEHPHTDFKFVVADEADLSAVLAFLDAHPSIPASRVWLMPEGTSAAVLTERTPWLMTRATELGFNFSSRLHVYGWADVRGH